MRAIKFRGWNREQQEMEFDTAHYSIDHDIMQYTGLKDKNGIDVYEGDIIHVDRQFSQEKYLCVVKFGEYKQDGSGGEYSPVKVLGFYADAFPNQLDEDGDPILYDFDLANSLLGIGVFKIVGNIYANPELLNR